MLRFATDCYLSEEGVGARREVKDALSYLSTLLSGGCQSQSFENGYNVRMGFGKPKSSSLS